MCVAEPHKTGDPHLHMLFHECVPYTNDAWDSRSVLTSQWPHGFSDVRGMEADDLKGVRYATKYLAKSALARVRASQHYGLLRGPELVQDAKQGTL
jgi:hypothetical protein